MLRKDEISIVAGEDLHTGDILRIVLDGRYYKLYPGDASRPQAVAMEFVRAGQFGIALRFRNLSSRLTRSQWLVLRLRRWLYRLK